MYEQKKAKQKKWDDIFFHLVAFEFKKYKLFYQYSQFCSYFL